MANYEKKTGGQLLDIAHNANLSNGRMFELVDFGGNPLSKEYAEKRARYEVLQEIVQTKGNSETHPLMSPNDEFAGDMGVAGWEYGNLTLTGSPLSKEMMPTTYLRGGPPPRGLEHEAKLGTNPFKFGFVGRTDVHNSLTAIEEDNFFGKLPIQEPSAKRWEHKSKESSWDAAKLGPCSRATRGTTLRGLRRGLGDREHARGDLGRDEATRGLRHVGLAHHPALLRRVGLRRLDAKSRFLAEAGYEKGVPMGGDLKAAPAGAKAPSFLVAAMKDARSGNLDRIQIVKGWLDKDGKGQEKVYDVVWGDADRRKVVGRASWRRSATRWTRRRRRGRTRSATRSSRPCGPTPTSTRRCGRSTTRASIEIPTPRWTAYDAARFGIKLPPEVPMTVQERAWASPIWYTPAR